MWTQCCLHPSDKHSIRRIGLQEFAYRLVSGLLSTNKYPNGFSVSLIVISIHKVYSILIEHAFFDNSDLFPIARTSGESQILGISAESVLYFHLGNMFCNNKITLAFRWRPCVNNRDTTRLSVASAIKSSGMMMLLYRALISHRFSDSSGTPLLNRMLFPSDVFKSS